MSFSIADIIRDTIAFWNRPAESDLSQDDIIAVINRKINRFLVLAQLTDKNYLAKISSPFVFDSDSREKIINIEDLSVVVRVESRSAGASDSSWSEAEIIDYAALGNDNSSDAVAFYGSAPDSFRMAANRDVESLEFRILYETGGVSLTNFADGIPVLQDFFKGAIFYGTASEAGMMIDNLSPQAENSRDKKVAFCESKEAQAIADFKKWLLTEKGQSVVYRTPFNSERLGAGMPRMFAGDGVGRYYSRY